MATASLFDAYRRRLGFAAGALPRPGGPKRAQNGPGPRRTVERVEVDSWGAARQQLLALLCGIGHSQEHLRLRVAAEPIHCGGQLDWDRRIAQIADPGDLGVA